MDELTEYLGDAVGRDWNRWRYDNPRSLRLGEGDVIRANMLVERTNHQEEVDEHKKLIHAHGAWLDENIDEIFGKFTDLDFRRGRLISIASHENTEIKILP